MAQSSYRKLQEITRDFELEAGTLLRMLMEERGVDTQDLAASTALLEEVDARKAEYLSRHVSVV